MPPYGVFGLEKPDQKRDQLYVQSLEDFDQKLMQNFTMLKCVYLVAVEHRHITDIPTERTVSHCKAV